MLSEFQSPGSAPSREPARNKPPTRISSRYSLLTDVSILYFFTKSETFDPRRSYPEECRSHRRASPRKQRHNAVWVTASQSLQRQSFHHYSRHNRRNRSPVYSSSWRTDRSASAPLANRSPPTFDRIAS